MVKIIKQIFIITVLVSFVWPSVAGAEEPNRSLHLYLSLGGMRITGTDDLDSELQKNGYPKLYEKTALLGSGIRYSGENFIIGLQGHIRTSEEESKDIYEVSYSVGYGLFEIGYNLISSGGLKVYPLLGIGGGGITINIRERDTADFDDTLNNPSRGSRLVHGDMIVDISLGMEYIIPLVKCGGLVIGAQIGYMYPVYDAGWKTGMSVKSNFRYMESVDGGPDFKFAGPHFQVNLGWAILL